MDVSLIATIGLCLIDDLRSSLASAGLRKFTSSGTLHWCLALPMYHRACAIEHNRLPSTDTNSLNWIKPTIKDVRIYEFLAFAIGFLQSPRARDEPGFGEAKCFPKPSQ